MGFTYIYDHKKSIIRIFGEILESKFDIDNSIKYEIDFVQDDTKFIEIYHYSEYSIVRLYSFEKGDPIKFKLNPNPKIKS